MRENGRPDVAAFHDDAAVRACPPLLGHHRVPHAGHHGNHGRRVRYFPRANQIRDVFAVKDHMKLPAARYEVNARRLRQRRKLRRRVQWHAVTQRLPRDASVHRSAIEMRVAQQFGYAPRHGALPGTHRAVNRDDEFAHPNSVKFV